MNLLSETFAIESDLCPNVGRKLMSDPHWEANWISTDH